MASPAGTAVPVMDTLCPTMTWPLVGLEMVTEGEALPVTVVKPAKQSNSRQPQKNPRGSALAARPDDSFVQPEFEDREEFASAACIIVFLSYLKLSAGR